MATTWYDNLAKKIEGLWKRELPENKATAIFQRLDVERFFNSLSNLWAPSELVKKLGGWSKLNMLYKDPDIYAAVDKRISALMDTKMKIENGPYVEFFEKNLRPHERKLKKDLWWSIFDGYGVEQIIYNEDLSGNVVGFQREQFWRFEPLPDLIHVRLITTDNNEWRNQVLPYGKFVLTVNNGTAYNPYGDSMGERLVMPWIFKCTSWDLWIDFAKKFANGYMIAKITDKKMHESIRSALERAGKSAILVTDKDTEITPIQFNRDSTLYKDIDERTVRTIQKVVLGETLTSDQSLRGSTGAAEVHNDVRVEKTMDDIDFLQNAFQEIVRQIGAVNGFDPDQLPTITLQYERRVTTEAVTQDNSLFNVGVRFKKPYFVEKYGMNPDEFEVVDPTAQAASSPFGFASRAGKTTHLTPKQMMDFIGVTVSDHKCPVHFKRDPEASAARKGTKAEDQREDIVAVLSRNGVPPLDPDELIAAITTSENRAQLEDKLNALFDTRNVTPFADLLTEALYYSASKGALLGNPEKVQPDEQK